ncbi:putative acetyl-CoA acyltransferase [compost metagenome]
MREVVIVVSTRTAIGAFQGTLSSVSAVELGAALVRRLLGDSGVEGYQIDEVILGQALTAGAGQNPVRQTALKAPPPQHTVPAFTLNKVCGSDLKAAQLAYQVRSLRAATTT